MLCPYHTVDSEYDKGNRKYLSHVEWERGFEGFLNFLGVFDEESESEDIGQAEAEIPASTDLLGHLFMEHPHHDKEDGIGDGFVKLSRMTRYSIDTFENKGPGHICYLADNLRVHEVAQTDAAGHATCSDGDIV